MAIAGSNVYPSIQTVLDLVRSLVLDDMPGATATVGEGQIYVDNMTVSVTLSNFFNSALRELCRQLRTTNGPMLIRDNYLLLGLVPINSTLGLAVPNPAVQTYVNAAGYYDGATMHAEQKLPVDLVTPIAVWERLNGSNGEFRPMTQAVGALAGVNQGHRFGEFEWRGEGLYMHGATTKRDLRLRYNGRLVNLYEKGVDVASTYIPIVDCEDVLADKIVRSVARRVSPERLADATDAAAKSLYMFINEQVKQKQGIEYQPQAFGTEAGPQLGF